MVGALTERLQLLRLWSSSMWMDPDWDPLEVELHVLGTVVLRSHVSLLCSPAGGGAGLLFCSLGFVLWMPTGMGRNLFFIEPATPLYPGVMHKALYVQVCGMGPHHLKFLSVLSGLEWQGSAHHLGIIVPLL